MWLGSVTALSVPLGHCLVLSALSLHCACSGLGCWDVSPSADSPSLSPVLPYSREQPIFTTRAHVFQIDPSTKKNWVPASKQAVTVSYFYDSTRNSYRIISVDGAKVGAGTCCMSVCAECGVSALPEHTLGLIKYYKHSSFYVIHQGDL